MHSCHSLSYLDSDEAIEGIIKFSVKHTYGLRLAVPAEPIIALLLACLFTAVRREIRLHEPTHLLSHLREVRLR